MASDAGAPTEAAGAAEQNGRGPYRGLLVDYGGVLTTDLFDSFRSFCEAEGLEPNAIASRFGLDKESRRLLVDFECGRVTEEEFEPQFATILGVSATQLIDRLFAGSQPDQEMLDTVARARRAGIRTGLISNSWGTRRYDRTRLAELFDGVVISGDVGIRKPSPEIYVMGAESIGVEPEACVFVDDLPFNLKPAADLGMATVHHTQTSETIAALERLLGIELT